jgi:hypothetical protein
VINRQKFSDKSAKFFAMTKPDLEISLSLMDINKYNLFTNEITKENVKEWKKFKPLNSSKIMKKVNKFIEENRSAKSRNDICKIFIKLYGYLNQNYHFLTYHDKFRETSIKKFNELVTDSGSECDYFEEFKALGNKVLNNIEKIEKFLKE